MDRIGCANISHFHVIVDNLDEASEFYRDVMDFVEMQSHHDLVNKGLATYYGFGDEPDNLAVSLRFMAWPGVLTLKLIKAVYKGYRSDAVYKAPATAPSNAFYATPGMGSISVQLRDIDKAYQHLSAYARDYSAKFKIQLISPPVFLSPLLPHQTGATKWSALAGQTEILQQLEKTFPERSKFLMIDAMGVRWEFNNNVD